MKLTERINRILESDRKITFKRISNDRFSILADGEEVGTLTRMYDHDTYKPLRKWTDGDDVFYSVAQAKEASVIRFSKQEEQE